MSIASRIEEIRTREGFHKPSRANVMVRMSPTLHQTLKDLAHQHHVSLNQLMVMALENCRDELFGKVPGVGSEISK